VATKDIQHARNWHTTNEGAIHTKKLAYLDETDDLFQINPHFRIPLWHFLEKSSRFGWLPVFRRKPQDTTSYDPDTMYYERNERIENFITIIVCLVGLFMLIAPLWILQQAPSPGPRLAIITTFIVAFLGLMQSVTIAKPFETLAATTA
jgi:hypothetical protein